MSGLKERTEHLPNDKLQDAVETIKEHLEHRKRTNERLLQDIEFHDGDPEIIQGKKEIYQSIINFVDNIVSEKVQN